MEFTAGAHVGQVSDLESAHQQLNALAEDAGDGQQRSRHQKTVATQGRSQADDGARDTADDLEPEVGGQRTLGQHGHYLCPLRHPGTLR